MAAKRERRGNAGSKMARLLDEEEEDDFYKTTYGGFSEEADDNDYQWVAPINVIIHSGSTFDLDLQIG